MTWDPESIVFAGAAQGRHIIAAGGLLVLPAYAAEDYAG